jgi:hypothetical protein
VIFRGNLQTSRFCLSTSYETVALPAELRRRGSGRLHPLASDSSSLNCKHLAIRVNRRYLKRDESARGDFAREARGDRTITITRRGTRSKGASSEWFSRFYRGTVAERRKTRGNSCDQKDFAIDGCNREIDHGPRGTSLNSTKRQSVTSVSFNPR